MADYPIALIGWGTVGGGVLDVLAHDRQLLSERCGLDIRVKTIVTRDPKRPRDQDSGDALLTTDLKAVLDDPEIKCVLHLVGGTEAGKDIVIDCLRAGKHVVTANKALLAEHWDEVFSVAQENNMSVAFEAAVAGGIPVIAALRDGLVANRIESIAAILNGTCNYILTQMEEEGLGYDEALEQAKDLGYAEADPTLDVNGTDTAHKLAILAQIAFNTSIPFDSIRIEGIENITAEDIASAQRMNCRIKLLAIAAKRESGIELRVAPTLVPNEFPLANVPGNYNAVRIDAAYAGPTLLVGQGAGAHPTASAVLADMIDVATGRYQETAAHFQFFKGATPQPILDEADETTASYGRFHVQDETGVLAKICTVLSSHGISVLSVNQAQPNDDGTAVVELTTHPARGGSFLDAIREIDADAMTVSPSIILRRLDC